MTNRFRLPRVALCAVTLVFVGAVGAVAQPTAQPVPPADSQGSQGKSRENARAAKKAVQACALLKDQVSDCYAEHLAKEVFHNKWLGIPTMQNPLDVWITQEIISEVKPDFIVETGTFVGGSAALWATILEQVNPKGRVITIDIHDASKKFRETIPILKKRVDFILGSSMAPEIVAKVKRRVAHGSVMVILDSGHTKGTVLSELRLYAPLVPVGGYVIVQDGFFDGKQPTGFEPGPKAATEAFLAENDSFVADRGRERLMGTFNPMGFLRRIK